MSQEDIVINGELLRLRREARGWVLGDLATRACMSVKQIRQLEEGGMSSFYSAAVKMTSAKKVAALLGLSTEELFAQDVESTPEPEAVEPEVFVEGADVAALENMPTEVMPAAQEAAYIELDTAPAHEPAAASVVEESKSKTSLWVITALFAAALAVAAYMQPQDEPDAEAAPPLQALPAEVADPASAASAADAPASSAEAVVLPASASVAPAPAAVASAQKLAPTPAASAPRVAVPVASGIAPVVVRPASANVVTPAPAVSAASK